MANRSVLIQRNPNRNSDNLAGLNNISPLKRTKSPRANFGGRPPSLASSVFGTRKQSLKRASSTISKFYKILNSLTFVHKIRPVSFCSPNERKKRPLASSQRQR